MSEAHASAADVRELAPGETHLAHAALAGLRPAHDRLEEFVVHVDAVLRPRGYRLAAVVVPGAQHALAVAGFRLADSLAWGRHLYVDDLGTLEHARRRGHAGALLDWLAREGRSLGCSQLHLDSGTGAERFAAHRLYHAHGFSIHSHHFARPL